MNLVERYIAAVQRELPEAKREEIGRELNANIMDQLDALREQQGSLDDVQTVAVLKHMGHPRAVAHQFVPPQPLISLGYMALYKNTLFMVFGILFLLQIADSTVDWLSSSEMGLFLYLKSVASGFLEDAIFAFSAITLGFWAMSQQQPLQQDPVILCLLGHVLYPISSKKQNHPNKDSRQQYRIDSLCAQIRGSQETDIRDEESTYSK